MANPPHVFATPEDLGAEAARIIADGIRTAGVQGRRFLLGCPSGRSPRSTYAALAQIVRDQQLDLSHLVIVMMDDYLVRGPDGGLVPEDPTAPHSCLRFAREQIVDVLSAAAGAGPARSAQPSLTSQCGIADDHLWMPDPAHPGRYDDLIREAGGIDIFLLASGATDGHVAFNPPGAARSSRTRVVELSVSTRTDNLATFPSFGGELARVPRYGVTVGLATIGELSQGVILLVHGADKGPATARLAAANSYDPTWPATIFRECRRPLFFVDSAAAEAAGMIVTRDRKDA